MAWSQVGYCDHAVCTLSGAQGTAFGKKREVLLLCNITVLVCVSGSHRGTRVCRLKGGTVHAVAWQAALTNSGLVAGQLCPASPRGDGLSGNWAPPSGPLFPLQGHPGLTVSKWA